MYSRVLFYTSSSSKKEVALGALDGKDKDEDSVIDKDEDTVIDKDKDTPVQSVRKKRLWELSEVKL